MEEHYRIQRILDKCNAIIVKHVVFHDIKDHCISMEIMDMDKADEIAEEHGNKQRMSKFLTHLYRHDLTQFYPRFKKCLEQHNGMDHVIKNLEAEDSNPGLIFVN